MKPVNRKTGGRSRTWLKTANCNAEVDPDINEWMMRDGEIRRSRCDECGWSFTVTARLEYEVGSYPPMKRVEMDA